MTFTPGKGLPSSANVTLPVIVLVSGSVKLCSSNTSVAKTIIFFFIAFLVEFADEMQYIYEFHTNHEIFLPFRLRTPFAKVISKKPHTELTDGELIALYKESGDSRWVGLLYNRYTSLVYGVCLKYLKDREESKDAVMQLFEKLLTLLKEHNVEFFKSWLYATTRNHCLMKLRSRKGKYAEEISPFLVETAAEVHQEEREEMESNLTKLEKCIEKLGNEQKACVQLFFLKEKCYKEITEITGYDLGQVKSFIQNGKRNLKLCMERQDE